MKRALTTLYGDRGRTPSFCYADNMVQGLLSVKTTADESTGSVKRLSTTNAYFGEVRRHYPLHYVSV